VTLKTTVQYNTINTGTVTWLADWVWFNAPLKLTKIDELRNVSQIRPLAVTEEIICHRTLREPENLKTLQNKNDKLDTGLVTLYDASGLGLFLQHWGLHECIMQDMRCRRSDYHMQRVSAACHKMDVHNYQQRNVVYYIKPAKYHGLYGSTSCCKSD